MSAVTLPERTGVTTQPSPLTARGRRSLGRRWPLPACPRRRPETLVHYGITHSHPLTHCNVYWPWRDMHGFRCHLFHRPFTVYMGRRWPLPARPDMLWEDTGARWHFFPSSRYPPSFLTVRSLFTWEDGALSLRGFPAHTTHCLLALRHELRCSCLCLLPAIVHRKE